MRDWRPSSSPQAAANRAAITRRLRKHFDANAVLEVDTPALCRHAVSDTNIESFAVLGARGASKRYLHTSPEFHMKRLLAAGYPDIYAICRVFRVGETGRRHQPEFTMVEWYRLGMDLDAIVADTLTVIDVALGDAMVLQEPQIIEYRQAFESICGVNPQQAPIEELATAASADEGLRTALGEQRDAWLDLLLTEQVIPSFATDRLTVLQHYPASQAALARLSAEDPALADRFEVFLGPMELANGYVELTDADEQRARMAADLQQRRTLGKPIKSVDDDLLAALDAGLPQCAGVAMGLERLQMLHDNSEDIRDVITFAFEDGND